MLEPFDTPMLDYQADDVEMDPSLEPWSHQMDTDFQILPEKFAEHDDVEIDMDAYPQDQEYEMSDADAEFAGEMVDVEELEGTESHSAFAPAPEVSLSDAPPAMDYPLSSRPQTPSQPFSDSAELAAPEIPEAITVAHSYNSGFEPEAQEEAPAAPEVVFADAPTEQDPALEPTDAEVHNDYAEPPADAGAAESEYYGDGGDAPAPEATADDTVTATEAPVTEAEYTYTEGDNLDADHATEQEESTESKDPHEISDGVFIEPPPGILLSFPDTNHGDVCLFNQASLASSSSAEHTEFAVLLRERPTLYYEPLTSVFEALRQDQYLANMTDLSASELVLDAFELQLVVSEVS